MLALIVWLACGRRSLGDGGRASSARRGVKRLIVLRRYVGSG